MVCSETNQTGVILADEFTCKPGFFCRNVNTSNPDSRPQFCLPSPRCQAGRLFGARCSAQGRFEPVLCDPGRYCPDFRRSLICPEGSFCPSGSTAPIKCSFLSACEEGSTSQTFYGGLIICAGVDLLLVIAVLIARSLENKRQRQQAAKHASQKKEDAESYTPTSSPREMKHRKTLHDKSWGPIDYPYTAPPVRKSSMPIGGSPTSNFLPSPPPMQPPMPPIPNQFNQPSLTPTGSPTRSPHQSLFPIPQQHQYGENKSPTSTVNNYYTMPSENKSELLVEAFSKGLGGRDITMRFKFDNMTLKVKEKSILKGMSGEIRPGKLTAIMGPSGAGKTSFMNVLMGKVQKTSGKLYLNSKETSNLSTFKKVIGFVPQEDVMLRELTVHENILHSARCRLPSSWSSRDINQHVDTIIKALDLDHVKYTKIGDETSRGISGGQRKRVNIGMELAAIPISLFLDEPTSGLDSTAALSVTRILKDITKIGQTVVAVMHQPRYEIFQQIDDLLLIVPGGETAYMGPANLAQAYFEDCLGYRFEKGGNPADIFMDILSKDAVKNNLPQKWIQYSSKFLARYGDNSNSDLPDYYYNNGQRRQQNGTEIGSHSEHLFHEYIKDMLKERGATWIQQVWWCQNRYFLQQQRFIGSLALEIFVGLAAGGLMGVSASASNGELYQGLLVQPYTPLSSAPLEYLVPLYGLLIGFSVVLAGAPAGVKVFSEEKPVYWREASSGHSQSAYYLGKTIATLPRFVLSSLHFTSIYVFFAIPMFPTFERMYAIVLLTFFGVYGSSTFVSCIVSRGNANLLAVVFGIFATVFCGFGPTLVDAEDWGILFLWEMSFNKWGTEALFSGTLGPQDGIYQIQISADNYGYTIGKDDFDLYMMFVIGCGYRVVSYVALRLTNRDKQK